MACATRRSCFAARSAASVALCTLVDPFSLLISFGSITPSVLSAVAAVGIKAAPALAAPVHLELVLLARSSNTLALFGEGSSKGRGPIDSRLVRPNNAALIDVPITLLPLVVGFFNMGFTNEDEDEEKVEIAEEVEEAVDDIVAPFFSPPARTARSLIDPLLLHRSLALLLLIGEGELHVSLPSCLLSPST